MPGMTPLSWEEGNALLNRSKHKKLQKVMILYSLNLKESIFVRGGKPCEFPCWLLKI
jgi:hypothetical protein